MLVGIQDEILRLHAKGLLAPLLADKTTKRNIIWATDAYRSLGFPYERTQEIRPALITGEHSDVIKTRARKEMEQQSERTRRHAEVFTPLAVCRQMIGDVDAAYFGGADPFMADGVPSARVSFPRRRKWQHYVATMEGVPLAERQGVLDRKLRIVCENTADETEWMRWTVRAYQATYGYEFQGDNLLIARVNLLMTFEKYLRARWRRKPTAQEYRAIIRTIVWNLWQMDGIRGSIPYAEESEPMELMLFDLPEEIEELRLFPAHTGEMPPVRIYDWRRKSGLEYRRVNTGGRTMKFDFVIGNPPYQDESNGDLRNYAPPIYHLFLDEAYKVADKVELIHPARFLFNAGSTPKAWNEKMLQDPHFKVLEYEEDSDKVFPNLSTPIKGGIVITYRDEKKKYGFIVK
ncbi:Eco57I restriction-modification methylase domain-containing protein [uncultured Selenomonas sp.]|uniref:Eco57I restriction-modification methylase domain-containing protein n=1 Tax=uncultured Selenomonas sp. TaxID=159275 RepID=UPI002676E716|nr:Eco57I restriction-modification methylase domain-containing protein [uncultured Selenomonas sp.]